jgi:hypothetical protein
MVTLQITNPTGAIVFADSVITTSSGAFNDTFHPGTSALWVSGTYTVKVTYGTLSSTTTFSYAPASGVTTTVTNTTTSPTTITATSTVTGQGSTTTVTQPAGTTTVTQPAGTTTVTQPAGTTTVTSVVTTTTSSSSSSVPDWVYAAMVVLLILGLVIGYVLAGSRSKKPAA